MSNITNINSSNIRIFPISFDRSKGSIYTVWTRKASTEGLATASDELKNYVYNNTYIIGSLPSIEGISNYYTKSTSNKALKDSYANGRILSEGNMSNLISALTDMKNFVIDYTDGNIEFVIKGHYFKATLPSTLQTRCYVGVNFKDDDNVYEILDAYDDLSIDNDVLKNVDFSSEALAEGQYDVVLHLLESSEVPIDSHVKFTSRSIENIDGGTV